MIDMVSVSTLQRLRSGGKFQAVALSPHWVEITTPPTWIRIGAPPLNGRAKVGGVWSRRMETPGFQSLYYTNELGDLQEIARLSVPVSSSGHWGPRYLLYLLHRLGMRNKWETRCENALKSLKTLSTCNLWFLSLPTLSEVTLYISFCDKKG